MLQYNPNNSNIPTPVYDAQGMLTNASQIEPNVNTNQPNPATVNPTPYTQGVISTRQVPGQSQTEYYNTQTNQGFANPQALSTFVNQQTGGNTNAQNIFDALKQGYSNLMTSGTPPPATQGEAYSAIQKSTPQPTVDINSMMGIYEQLPEYKQFQADMQMANSMQFQSSAQMMQDLMKQYDIQGLDTKMINLESVINGTENDIANEVKAVGGFATQGQVMALANVRNKSLIEKYNQLQRQKESAMQMVNNLSSAYVNDRNFAMQAINQRLQFDQQALEIKTKMISAAQEGVNNYIKAVGYSGLYNALQNDPSSLALIEKTMGLPSGTIASAASREIKEQQMTDMLNETKIKTAQAELENIPLERKLKQAQIDNIRSEIANRGKEKSGVTETIEKIGDKNYIVSKQNGRIVGMQEFTGQIANPADSLVKTIISTSANWGDAADKINKAFGNQNAATQYDQQLKGVFGQGRNVEDVFNAFTPEQASKLTKVKTDINDINSLLQNSSLRVNVGTNPLTSVKTNDWRAYLYPGIKNFVGSVEQLTNTLTNKKLIDLKAEGATFGALNEQEFDTIRNSATKINQWAKKDNGKVVGYDIDEKSFRNELIKINNFAKLDYIKNGGDPSEVGIYRTQDGRWLSDNLDGKTATDITEDIKPYFR